MDEVNLNLDHIVVFVDDMDSARQAWGVAGFTVTAGGEHALMGTTDALVVFESGEYLELVTHSNATMQEVISRLRHGDLGATRPATSLMGRRFLDLAARGPGVRGFALRTLNLTAYLERAADLEIPYEAATQGSRTRSDGSVIQWRTSIPFAEELPFLIEDVTPTTNRIPDGSARVHANGASCVSRIDVGVRDLEYAIRLWSELTDRDPMDASGDETGTLNQVRFDIGQAHIMLTSRPENETSSSSTLSFEVTGPNGIIPHP